MLTSKHVPTTRRGCPPRFRPVRSAGALVLGVAFGAMGCATKTGSKTSDFGGSSVQTAIIRNTQGVATGINMVSTTEVNCILINAPVEKAWAALQ